MWCSVLSCLVSCLSCPLLSSLVLSCPLLVFLVLSCPDCVRACAFCACIGASVAFFQFVMSVSQFVCRSVCHSVWFLALFPCSDGLHVGFLRVSVCPTVVMCNFLMVATCLEAEFVGTCSRSFSQCAERHRAAEQQGN